MAFQETMQENLEASLKGLGSKALRCNCQECVNRIEESQDYKDEMNAHQGGLVESDDTLKREAFAPPGQGYNIPLYLQAYWGLPNFNPGVQNLWSSHLNIFETPFYPMNWGSPFLLDTRIQYLQSKMFSQGYPHDFQFQEFQYFVVIDFEATCDKENNPHPQEIIEFPSVLVNGSTGDLEDSFQTYVRPSYHQHLSDFCKDLTGIQQIQVDRGVPLSEALLMHDKWLEEKGVKNTNFAVVTWTNWDCRVMLESECRFKKFRKPPYFNRWINLKVPFQEVYGTRCNLKEAVELAGLAWEGRAHCGLDDARNTARILSHLMSQRFRFSITSSLVAKDATLPSQRPEDQVGPNVRVGCPNCYCGVESNRCVIRKPGPMQGRCFFGCGNWTRSRCSGCQYFVWAT